MNNLPALSSLVVPAILAFVTSVSSFFIMTPKVISPVISQKTPITAASPSVTPTVVKPQAQDNSTDKHTGQAVSGNKSAVLSEQTQQSSSHQIPSDPTPTQASEGNNTSPQTATNNQPAHMITAESTISSSGKTIHLTMKYPSNGGAITGTLSGDCTGTLSGQFAGPATGALSGNAKASCKEGFFSIPVTIAYTGKLVPGATKANINYTVSALGKSDNGNTTLMLSE